MNTLFRFFIYMVFSFVVVSCNQNVSQETSPLSNDAEKDKAIAGKEIASDDKKEKKSFGHPSFVKEEPGREKVAADDKVKSPGTFPLAKVNHVPQGKIFSRQIKDLEALYQQLQKPSQVYVIDPKKEILIQCNEGTRLTIPANAFVRADGSLVRDSVRIEVGEYLSISDFLLANLSTSSDGQILESGGMLNIKAMSAGKEVTLKRGSSIVIEVPAESFKDDMQLFYGQQGPHGGINWTTEKLKTGGKKSGEKKRFERKFRGSFATLSEVMTITDTTGKLIDLVQDIHEWADSAKKVEKIDSVEFSFTINKKGEIKNEKIYKNNKLIKNAKLRIARYNYYYIGDENKTRKISFNRKDGYNFYLPGDRYNYHLTGDELKVVKNKIKETKGSANIHVKHLFAKRDSLLNYKFHKYKDSVSQINWKRLKENYDRQADSYLFVQADSAAMETAKASRYVFAATKLNWINIDRFLKDPGEPVNMIVNTEEGSYADVKVVFGRINSIMPGAAFIGKSEFLNMPLGEPITIVAVMMKENSPYLAIKESTVQAGTIEGLEFKPVSLEDMKKIIAKIK